MTFHVGQRVVCVVANHGALKAGKIYVVTSTRGWADAPGYILVENGGGSRDGGWCPSRFRPLIERKASTDAGFEVLDEIRRREMVSV